MHTHTHSLTHTHTHTHTITDICSVINVSYQNISLSLLSDYLGEALEGKDITDLATRCGWTVNEGTGTVQIHMQETTIKSKKILSKIEFDSKLKVYTHV